MSNEKNNHEQLTPLDSKRAAEIGALGGKAKKGSPHLSTLIRDVVADIDWENTTLKNKAEIKEKFGKNGWKAIVYVAVTKAMTGDTKAMEWLAKNGYGEKLRVEIDDPRKEILAKYGLGDGDAGKTEEA